MESSRKRGGQVQDLKKRFERFISPRDDGCLIWVGNCDTGGYGMIKIAGKTYKAHRAFWEFMKNEKIPDGLDALHKCDVPSCVNPDHIFLGTVADNMRDMREKGRANILRGEANSNSKLKEADVLFIRTSELTNASLARRFGVSPRTIRLVRIGETWKTT